MTPTLAPLKGVLKRTLPRKLGRGFRVAPTHTLPRKRRTREHLKRSREWEGVRADEVIR